MQQPLQAQLPFTFPFDLDSEVQPAEPNNRTEKKSPAPTGMPGNQLSLLRTRPLVNPAPSFCATRFSPPPDSNTCLGSALYVCKRAGRVASVFKGGAFLERSGQLCAGSQPPVLLLIYCAAAASRRQQCSASK